jgi:hypothetical protein
LNTSPSQSGADLHPAPSPAQDPERQVAPSQRTAGEYLAETRETCLVDDAAAQSPTVLEPPLFLSLAAALAGDRGAFLEALDHAVDGGVLPEARDLPAEGGDPSDESAVFDEIVAAFVVDRAPPSAVVVAAALAARTVSLALLSTEHDVNTAVAEALLAAWVDAAHAVWRLRGADGLMRLVPAARNLARRAVERGELTPTIADAMRRVAARIADAEHSLGQTPRRLPQRQERERMGGGAFDLPRRVVIRGELQLTFHAR